MRIVYLHQYFVTPRMAGGSRSYEMARRLVAVGHEVHMVTSDQHPLRVRPKWRETKEAGIIVLWTAVPYDNRQYYRQSRPRVPDLRVARGAQASELRGDVVFATSTPLTIAHPAVYAARRRAPNGIRGS